MTQYESVVVCVCKKRNRRATCGLIPAGLLIGGLGHLNLTQLFLETRCSVCCGQGNVLGYKTYLEMMYVYFNKWR